MWETEFPLPHNLPPGELISVPLGELSSFQAQCIVNVIMCYTRLFRISATRADDRAHRIDDRAAEQRFPPRVCVCARQGVLFLPPRPSGASRVMVYIVIIIFYLESMHAQIPVTRELITS